MVQDGFFPINPNEESMNATKHQESNTMHFLNEIEDSAKPKLLQDLEKFLEKELQILNVTDTEYNELTFLVSTLLFIHSVGRT